MSSFIQSPLADEPAQPSLFGPILTASMIAAAGIVYLFTRHPLLAAILPWLHGRWSTFCTGFWILRADPRRPRARVCFVFYLAAACWKAAIASLVTIVVITSIASECGLQPNEKEIVPVTLAFLAGLLLNTILGIVAVIAALVCKVRVYVRADLQMVLRYDLKRAALIGPSPRNSSKIEFIVAATAAIVPLILIGTTLAMFVLGENLGGQHGFEPLIGIAIIFGVPLSGIPLVVWLCSRVVSESPRESWPPGTC
jgi:hypothetical protein